MADPVASAVTERLNAPSDALAVPSVTLITMPVVIPTSPAPGVPCSKPVEVLNVAHAGRFAMLNVSVLPSASAAVGRNEYSVPCSTDVAGAPEIVGARFVGTLVPLTVIANAGSEALAEPSLALMTMFENVPAFVDAGVPVSRPVVELKVAQLGRLAIANVSVLPSGSLAVGVNE